MRNRWHSLLLVLVAVSAFGTALSAQEPRPRTDALEPGQPETPAARLSGGMSDDANGALSVDGRYRITPGDVLSLTFPLVPEFDQTLTVQPDGYISLLNIGDLRVQGRTTRELHAALIEAYQAVLLEPRITVVLKEFEQPYFIAAGEVAKPGKYELRGATTVTQALAISGGQTRAGQTSQVLLFRRYGAAWVEVKAVNVKRMYEHHDLAEDYLLRPGDTVFVPQTAWSKVAPFLPRPSVGLYINPFSW
jgi:polysaccharide export outer membrane protein